MKKSALKVNETLAAGQQLWSPNEEFMMEMQSDGNLVLYRMSDSKPLWASATQGNGQPRLTLQKDGNLVVYAQKNKPVWQSATVGQSSTGELVAALQDDGNFVVYDKRPVSGWADDGKIKKNNFVLDPIWASGAVKVLAPPDRLEVGETLGPGESLRSKNGVYALTLQKDGNLLLRRRADGAAAWSSGSAGSGGTRLILQKDDNLVLYTASGKAVWASGTAGQSSVLGRVFALLQDDGNFVLYDRITYYPGGGPEVIKEAKQVLTPLWDTGLAGHLLADKEMDALYHKLGGQYGSLGQELGGVQHLPDGSYLRKFELGEMHTLDGEVPTARTYFEVTPRIAAIKCFGTDDPGGTDELYAVISLIRLDPAYKGEDELVKTTALPPQKVHAGQVFAESTPIGVARPAGTGIKIHVALFDQEHGDYETVRKGIEDALRDAIKAGAAAIAAGDLSLLSGVPAVLDNKYVKLFTGALSGEVAKLFADDLIDQKVFTINSGDVLKLANQAAYEASLKTSNDFGPNSHIRFNWPPTIKDKNGTPYDTQYDMSWLFSNGDASYKVYLHVKVKEVPMVIEPPTL